MKRCSLICLIISALFLTSCKESEGDYKFTGYVVTGTQGAAEPLKGIHVHIYNSYEEVIYAETHTSDAGIFVLKIRRDDISDVDGYDWSDDVRLIVNDDNNRYYSTSRSIAYPTAMKPTVDCGVIFLSERNK